jgi:flagellar motor switch protein FliM
VSNLARFKVGDWVIFESDFDINIIIKVNKDGKYNVKQGPNRFNYRVGLVYHSLHMTGYRLLSEEEKAVIL